MSQHNDGADVLRWASEHTTVDFLVAAVIVGAHAVIAVEKQHGDWLGWLQSGQRLSIYSTGATVIAVLGGLSAIALALYQSAGGTRAVAVRKHYGDEVRRNWRGLLIVAGLSSLLCLVAQAIDVAKDPHYGRFVFEFALVLASIRFIRLIWLFNNILQVADKDLTDRARPAPPELDPRWRERRKVAN